MPRVNRKKPAHKTGRRIGLGLLAGMMMLVVVGLAWTFHFIQRFPSQFPHRVMGELPLIERYSGVNQLSFSPDGQLLTTASHGGTTHLWNLQGKLLSKFPGKQVIFSPNGTLIATVSEDTMVHLWNLQGEQLVGFKGHDSLSGGLQFSPDGQHLLTVANGTPKRWDLQGNLVATFEPIQPRDTKIQFNQDGVTLNMTLRTLDEGAIFSPDGQKIASAANSLKRYHVARLWDLQGHQLVEFKGHQGPINQVVFSPDGKYLATASSDRTARLWDLQGHPLVEFKGHQEPVAKLRFSLDGQFLATLAGKNFFENSISLWDLHGNRLREFKPESVGGRRGRWGLSNFAFSPDGKTLAVLWTQTFGLFDLQGQELPLAQEPGKYFQGRPDAIVYSPDGQRIAIASDNGGAVLFDLQGRKLASFGEN